MGGEMSFIVFICKGFVVVWGGRQASISSLSIHGSIFAGLKTQVPDVQFILCINCIFHIRTYIVTRLLTLKKTFEI